MEDPSLFMQASPNFEASSMRGLIHPQTNFFAKIQGLFISCDIDTLLYTLIISNILNMGTPKKDRNFQE